MPVRLLALMACALLLAAAPAWAQEDPPFPEYPAFQPGSEVMGDQQIFTLLFVDRLEAAPLDGGVPTEASGFYRVGTDYNRLYLKAEAEAHAADLEGEGEAQLVYSRLVTPYFEAQGGLRLDAELESGPVRLRPQLAAGLMGLAPYWFEMESMLFVSAQGDVSARLEAAYDLLITQRLVVEAETEINAALQSVSEWDVATGLNDVELGLRLRYEVVREVAPYVGLSWTQRFGESATLAGESSGRLVFGLRLWR